LRCHTLRHCFVLCAVAATLPGCGGTNCQDITDQYATEHATVEAEGCNPNEVDACSVALPCVVEGPGANRSPSYALGGDCDGAFDPSQSMKLQALYAEFVAQSCKTVIIPIPPKTPANPNQCVPTDNASDATATGYYCN
jgi:hypothetical protein